MTKTPSLVHCLDAGCMISDEAQDAPFHAGEPGASVRSVRVAGPAFLDVYRTHFAFVWRTVQQLGVERDAAEDVVQEVFIVVHRRLVDFEGRSTMRVWLYGIARRVIADLRKSRRRKPAACTEPSALDELPGFAATAATSTMEARDLVLTLLDQLDPDKREVFVLTEIEGMTLAEISECIGVNANTVGARLRAARRLFEEALARHEGQTP